MFIAQSMDFKCCYVALFSLIFVPQAACTFSGTIGFATNIGEGMKPGNFALNRVVFYNVAGGYYVPD
jgi:hypothetical protein